MYWQHSPLWTGSLAAASAAIVSSVRKRGMNPHRCRIWLQNQAAQFRSDRCHTADAARPDSPDRRSRRVFRYWFASLTIVTTVLTPRPDGSVTFRCNSPLLLCESSGIAQRQKHAASIFIESCSSLCCLDAGSQINCGSREALPSRPDNQVAFAKRLTLFPVAGPRRSSPDFSSGSRGATDRLNRITITSAIERAGAWTSGQSCRIAIMKKACCGAECG